MYSDLAQVFHGLSDGTRIRIIESIGTGSKNVTELSKELGVDIANVSHHLKALKTAGLVIDIKNGRFVDYRLNEDVCRETTEGIGFYFPYCKIEFADSRKGACV